MAYDPGSNGLFPDTIITNMDQRVFNLCIEDMTMTNLLEDPETADFTLKCGSKRQLMERPSSSSQLRCSTGRRCTSSPEISRRRTRAFWLEKKVKQWSEVLYKITVSISTKPPIKEHV